MPARYFPVSNPPADLAELGAQAGDFVVDRGTTGPYRYLLMRALPDRVGMMATDSIPEADLQEPWPASAHGGPPKLQLVR
jgi:hypothetical protein